MAKMSDINNTRKADLFWLTFIPRRFCLKYLDVTSREWKHLTEELIYFISDRNQRE